MRTKPELKCTRDYTVFEMHEFNRPLHDDPVLFQSMKDNGWMPSSPAQVVKSGNGRLKVVRGHHRLAIAKQLGIPVWYVIDETVADPWSLEGCRSAWTGHDFAVARAANGDKDVKAVIDFSKKHGINLGVAASLLGGESAGSSNKMKMIKTGTFKIAGDTSHAQKVVWVIDRCREVGIEFATATPFVSAVSMMVYLPEFDPNVFIHKVRQNKDRLERRGTSDRFLDEIEAIYNFAAKKSVNLAFLAREASKVRRAVKCCDNSKKAA